MPAPAQWKVSDLTPALIKAIDGPIRTILGLVDALGVQ